MEFNICYVRNVNIAKICKYYTNNTCEEFFIKVL